MARETKFRAWDPFNAVMIYSKILSNFFNSFEKADIGGNNPKLMQFTGLLDKNEKEIFEGDLLAPMDNDFRPEYRGNWVVVYDDGTFAAEGNSERISTWIPYWVPEKQIEVIGNIWENPELKE